MSNRDDILGSVISEIDCLTSRIDTASETDRLSMLVESGVLLGVLRELMNRGHLPKTVLCDLVEIQEDLIQQVVRLSQPGCLQAAVHA